MPPKQSLLFSWSGGKDSAMALHALLNDERYDVVALLTTVSGEYGRVSHHGVREQLLEQQAQAIGIELDKLYLSSQSGLPCTNEQFEQLMGQTLSRWRKRGVKLVGHGDIFLEDLRAYRDSNLAKVQMTGVYPLWQGDTTTLAHRFIDDGFRAYLSCVEGEKLGPEFAGRAYDHALLADLPEGVDPCGEYGEFHSFVHDGPIFRHPVPVTLGQRVTRENRHYIDLLPADATATGEPAPAMPPTASKSG